MRSWATATLVLVCGAGCAPLGGGAPPPDPADPDHPADCADPAAGLTALEETAAQRGVDLVLTPTEDPGQCLELPGGVVAEDMDADGDVDLMFWRAEGFPALYRNDGGRFEAVPVELGAVPEVWGRAVASIAAVDLDDDRLPEVILVAAELVLAAPNLGGLSFGPFEVLYERSGYPRACTASLAVGDPDGDGDLDMYLPALMSATDATFNTGTMNQEDPDSITPSPDRLLINADGTYVDRSDRVAEADATFSLVAAFTDRDGDGDQDLLSASHTPYPTLFFRNDGVEDLALVEDSVDIGFSLQVSSMGIASGDLNADGLLDYCISDARNNLVCMLSGDAGYYGAGVALGLTTTRPPGELDWTGWSVEIVDLDNDGRLDALATAGIPPDQGLVGGSEGEGTHQDALWRGTDSGFESIAAAVGFNSPEDHYGAAVADLDDDGTLDIIVGGYDDGPHIWSLGCTEGAWLQADLSGPPGNRLGIGARVTAEADGQVWIREVLGPVGLGQSSARAHLGLGDVEVLDRVEVLWADGATTELSGVATRQRITITHPEG